MRERPSIAAPSAIRLNLLDRVLGIAFPETALERGAARARLDAAETGGYRGGRKDRRMLRTWRPPAGSADADTLPDLPDLRARSRDEVRNNPIATGAIATNVTQIVGDELQLQAALDADVLGMTAEEADAWERAAEKEYRLFCQNIDFTRVQKMGGLQRLVFRSVLESGDCFVIRRFRADARCVYGTKLQVIEADRVSNPNRCADTETLAGGIEHDNDGVPVAYHVTTKHPGGSRVAGLEWRKIAGRTAAGVPVILHLYDRSRPELTRGLPYLAPVIEHLKTLSRYSDAEVTAAVVSSMYTVFIESTADEANNAIAGETDATLAANEVKLGNGAILSLSPGEKANTTMPGRPNSNFDPFFQAIARQIGVALELPFELLVKHFTASYSASRAALEMAWAFFRCRRAWLAAEFCQVVYEWFLEEAIARGRLSAPGFFDDPLIRQAYAGAEWIGPARMSIDPLKEANADKIDIELGTKTREQVCLERTGGQWEDKHRQAAREQATRDADGLSSPPPAQVPPPPSEETDAGDDDENEIKNRRSA